MAVFPFRLLSPTDVAFALAIMGFRKKLQPVAHFRQLHELNIELFKRRLTVIAGNPNKKETEKDIIHNELHDLLHRYVEAIADLEQMNVRKAVSKPESCTKESDAEGGPKERNPQSEHFELVSMVCPIAPDTADAQYYAAFIDLIINAMFQTIVASLVGVALLVPMIIMVLHPSRNTSLITTCVFVPAFALGLVILNHLVIWTGASLQRWEIGSDILVESTLQTKDVIGATAAYAAVLVVFVGVSN